MGTIFFRGYGVLWYVWALLVLMPIFIILAKKIKCKWFYLVLAFGAMFVQKAFTHYGYQDNLPFYLIWCKWLYQLRDIIGIEWLLKGMTNLSIGTMFAVSSVKLPRWSALLLIIIGSIEMIFETHKGLAVALPLISIGAFNLILNLKIKLGNGCGLILRKLSSLIYFTHISVIMLYTHVLRLEMTIGLWCLILLTCIVWASILLFVSRTPIGRPLAKAI